MCGRFTLTSSQEQIAKVLPGLVFDVPIDPRYNIAPTQSVATVLNDERMSVSMVQWGLIPSWAKDRAIGNRMINARAETLAEKSSFKRPFKSQRCLILADGFYEWKQRPGKTGKTGKTPVYIYLRDHRPFAFAGLWDRWKSPDQKVVVSCTIITTEANEMLVPIHSRMPVIIAPRYYEQWLAPQDRPPESMISCLQPIPSSSFALHEVSKQVNRATFDDPVCIKPAESDRSFD
ncbi:MAG: SOS response-associated peptidase [Phycisphaerae bacterium]